MPGGLARRKQAVRGRPVVKLLPDFHCGKDYIKLEGGVPAEIFLHGTKFFEKLGSPRNKIFAT